MAYRRWPNDHRGGGGGWDASEWAFLNAIETLTEQRRRAHRNNQRTLHRVIWPAAIVFSALILSVITGIDLPDTIKTYQLSISFASVLSTVFLLVALCLEARMKYVDLDEFLHPDPAASLTATMRKLTEEAEALHESNERLVRRIRICNRVALFCAAASMVLLAFGFVLLVVL